jgi:Fe-S oxidoreductase
MGKPETEQLYFDQKKRMVLQKENLNYQIKGNFNGQGIDFSKDFKVINSQNNWRNTICRLISKQYELLKIYTIRLPGFGAYFI